jgi:hypothetical protein
MKNTDLASLMDTCQVTTELHIEDGNGGRFVKRVEGPLNLKEGDLIKVSMGEDHQHARVEEGVYAVCRHPERELILGSSDHGYVERFLLGKGS